MAYSGRMKAGIGAVRATLAGLGIGVQDARFTRHGEHEPDADAPLVLVACSGGRDSIALAALARTVCATLGVRCGAAIIDHNMQAGSAQVADQAADRCRALGLDPVIVRQVRVDDDDRGAEAAARDARYAALADIARDQDASVVLLAHTKNDQAETVLIGLLRSAGVDALAGMPAMFRRDGVRYARPLLGLTRADTTGICEGLGLAWWDDPTNGDISSPCHLDRSEAERRELVEEADGTIARPTAFARNDRGGGRGENHGKDASLPLRSRIRHGLIPYLEDFAGRDIVAHLADGARPVRRDKEYMDMQADAAAARARLDPAGDVLRWSVKALESEHPAIRARVIAHDLAAAGVAATARQIESVDRLVADWHGQSAVQLSRGYSVFRQKHVIRVCQDGGHANR
ncbi:tRNA lysidine(34) synthetase TilS [Bifidobacterium biavatii]|uniref:tRNA(Ile)-lysidine synthase n=1 Tax=Bifidobacterium biavatii DSM 23969 TaxID=1437608 RepID=A0A087A2P9_9BIFI|nr:tRNA lysidine(34) synthetase TilS [Bifidobacterium biavatii]KFI53049.1 tRNA(Ile)-lysidine synthetase [Bifidobacterium biavatii DSM 23969]